MKTNERQAIVNALRGQKPGLGAPVESYKMWFAVQQAISAQLVLVGALKETAQDTFDAACGN